MNLDITTLPHASSVTVKNILNQDGVTCSLALLAPGDELSTGSDSAGTDHLLFVVDGSLTVQLDELNFLLNKDQAIHVAKEKSESIRNQSDAWAKLLRVDLPSREIIAAPIFTVPDEAPQEHTAGKR